METHDESEFSLSLHRGYGTYVSREVPIFPGGLYDVCGKVNDSFLKKIVVGPRSVATSHRLCAPRGDVNPM